MTNLGIIKRVTDPTDWVSSLVTVMKPNGKIRWCLDPKDLNKAIKREYYSLPTAGEIFVEIQNPTFFTKLDASNEYRQIKFDEESSRLLTFNTPFGRFKYTRLPYGIHRVSWVYQKELARFIEGNEGTKHSLDDIIWFNTMEEHIKRLSFIFNRLRKCGLKLNKHKCTSAKSRIIYQGHLITNEGLKPDPKKWKPSVICLFQNVNQTCWDSLGWPINYASSYRTIQRQQRHYANSYRKT